MKTIPGKLRTIALCGFCLALTAMFISASSATDDRGIIRKKKGRAADAYCTPSQTGTEKRFALVMGNGDYRSISPLKIRFIL